MYVVFIAGGPWQLPFVKFLKDRTIRVYVVNPTKTLTTEIADRHIEADVRDIAKIIDELGGYLPKFVTSDQSDIAVMPVAQISAMLGTPRNDIGSVALFTDKSAMGDYALTERIPFPHFGEVNSVDDIDKFICHHGLPIVLKPIDANASKGFVKVEDVTTTEDLQSKLNYSKSFSYIKKVIAQKYIEGNMVILDGVCSNYKHKTLATGDKKHFRDGVASEINYPSKLKKELLDEIIRANDKYVDDSGLCFGLTHAEYIVDDKGFYLLEIAARGGGFAISSHIVPWVSGVDTHRALYDNLLGSKLDVKGIKIGNKMARLKFYEYPTGKVLSVEGVGQARSLPNVTDFDVMVNIGQEIKPAIDGTTRHAYALIRGNTEQEIEDATRQVEEVVKVRIE